jgi:hypothetical protein
MILKKSIYLVWDTNMVIENSNTQSDIHPCFSIFEMSNDHLENWWFFYFEFCKIPRSRGFFKLFLIKELRTGG